MLLNNWTHIKGFWSTGWYLLLNNWTHIKGSGVRVAYTMCCGMRLVAFCALIVIRGKLNSSQNDMRSLYLLELFGKYVIELFVIATLFADHVWCLKFLSSVCSYIIWSTWQTRYGHIH